MLRGILLSSALSVLISILATPVLLAQAIQVKIVGPDSAYTTHDITTIALDLGEMLKAAPGYSGSTATATAFSGRSLIEAYYHPEKKSATRTVLDTKYEYLVILPEVGFLNDIPEATFDGVLQMSRRALNAGTTPLLLMPRGGTVSIATMGGNSYRIGNGSGIATAPGGYAVDSAGLSSPGTNTRNIRRQAYVLAATLFSQITGLNAATNTTYVPKDSGGVNLDVANLAGKAASAVTTHASTSHYTTSRHLSGIVSYRNITLPNNRVRYAFTGTSTENGISDKLDEIIQATGHITAPHIRPTSDGQTWTQAIFDKVKPTFDAAPNEYLFLYGRNTEIAAQLMIDYNQANLIPIYIDRHYDGVQSGDLSSRILMRDLHQRTSDIYYYYSVYGWKGAPIHLGHARLNDVDSTIYYSGDGTHMTSENYYMVASMMFTSMLGKDPTPPASLTAKQLKGFNVGKQMAKELAFLSETMAFTPESSLVIVPPAPLEKARWETFSHTFNATGGTAPYTWSETSTTGLPPGLSLSANGVLSGAVTAAPQAWKLVIKVTDAAGAIYKVPVALNIINGAGSLAVIQTTSFSAVIPPGGPAPSATATYTVQNPGLTSINWRATTSKPWLSLSPATGTLAAGASVNVTVSMNSGVNTLLIGTHTDTISFTNTTNGFGNTTRGVSLRVSAPPSIEAGAARNISLEDASTPWTPAVLNPVGWYDASDATTVTQASGLVSEWRSKNGTSHMLQATASKQPLIGTTQINGLNTIKFDGDVDAFKTATNPFGTTIRNAMVMSVSNIGTLSGTMFSLSGSSNESNRWQADVANSSGNVVFDCGGSSGSSRLSFSSGWSAHQNKLLGFYSSEKAKVQQVWESGLLRASDTTGNTAAVNSGMALGNNGAHTEDSCAMGEVVIINGVVADPSRQGLEGYLAHKWGFASTLPVNHPYKTAPIGIGSLVTLSGITASDADNDSLSYTWTVVSAPNGFTIGELSSLTPVMFFSLPGTYILRLTVSDGYSETSEDITIHVVKNIAPVANAGADQEVALNDWTPEALNPVGWYDATDNSTIFQSAGAVSEWRSKVGTSHMLQATSSKRPSTGTRQINGLNAIAFDGTNDALKTASNPFGSKIDNALLMAVMNVGTIGNAHTFSLSGIASDKTKRWQANVPNGDNKLYFDCGNDTGVNRVTTSAGWTAYQNKLVGFYGSITDNRQQIWESGNLLIGDTSGHSVNIHSGMALGHNGADTYDNCTMGEVVIINGVVSNDDRQKIEGYLAHKWNMTANMPTNHPYKLAPPSYARINLNGTASDSNNDPLTYNWNVVNGPTGYVIENANSLNATLVTNSAGTYTVRLTVSDDVLQTTDEVTIHVSNPTPYQIWTSDSFTEPFTSTGPNEDPDGDGFENILEFAFGMNPSRSSSAPIDFVPDGNVNESGAPLLSRIAGTPEVFHAVFARRKDHVSAGISYTVQFSADLTTWTESYEGLSVVTNPNSAGAMEAVSVPFPSSVPLGTGGTALPTFFRVSVTEN